MAEENIKKDNLEKISEGIVPVYEDGSIVDFKYIKLPSLLKLDANFLVIKIHPPSLLPNPKFINPRVHDAHYEVYIEKTDMLIIKYEDEKESVIKHDEFGHSLYPLPLYPLQLNNKNE